MAKITSQGFLLKTQNEYFELETTLYLGIDSKWNLDPSTPDGLKIASDAELFSNLDETAQLAYNSKDPDKARDLELNIICALSGVVRDDGSPSTVLLTLSGVDGTIIPAGSLIESSIDSSQWSTATDVTIASGSAVVSATSTKNGSIPASINSLTNIVNSIGGWQSVTNNAVAILGKDQETNAELRLRRNKTVGRPGSNQIDSMLGEIGAVDNVGRFKIYENDNDVVDANSLPAHSIAVIVEAGVELEVAQAIYAKKTPGVKLHASGTPVVVNVTSSVHPSNNKDITFSRPTLVDMIINVTIVTDGSLVTGTAQEIKDAILEYINGSLVDSQEGFNDKGFDIGENVAVSRIYTPINQVIGKLGNSYISSMTVNSQTDFVPIAFNELSRWLDANISVSII